MKIFLIHNRYQSLGGEDSVFSNERRSLINAGHEVLVYEDDNARIDGSWQKLRAAFAVIYSIRSARKIRSLLQAHKPDVVHVHNFFPLISPSVFWVCQEQKIPVVHTLHNFRTVCPTGLLFFDGEVVERSVTGRAWWAVHRKVYRDSVLGTFVVTLSVEIHKYLGTWTKKVDAFITLTDFSKNKFAQAGWPIDKLYVKPNYTVALSGNTPEIKLEHKKFALFVGRLSPEKGIEFLIDSWSELGYQLYIVGSGPELELVKNLDSDNITILGQLGQREVRALMRSAKFLVMTSVWYEGFPMILSEAFESSLPAIVPNHGSMGTIIMHEENGLKYIAGNKASFRATVARLFEDNRLRKKLSLGAKKSYVSYYSEAENVSQLIEIYRTVIAKRNLTLESHK